MQRDNDDGNEEEAETAAQDNFEPSEEVIPRVIDMGFSREHAINAIESTRSNSIDDVMEYALSIGHRTDFRSHNERLCHTTGRNLAILCQLGPTKIRSSVFKGIPEVNETLYETA